MKAYSQDIPVCRAHTPRTGKLISAKEYYGMVFDNLMHEQNVLQQSMIIAEQERKIADLQKAKAREMFQVSLMQYNQMQYGPK